VSVRRKQDLVMLILKEDAFDNYQCHDGFHEKEQERKS